MQKKYVPLRDSAQCFGCGGGVVLGIGQCRSTIRWHDTAFVFYCVSSVRDIDFYNFYCVSCLYILSGKKGYDECRQYIYPVCRYESVEGVAADCSRVGWLGGGWQSDSG